MRRARLDSLLAVLLTVYLSSIVVANAVAAKMVSVAGIPVTAGALAIPFMYVTADLLHELYGREHARQAVWMGLLGGLLLVVLSSAAVALPTASGPPGFDAVFAATPRMVVASSVAYLLSGLVDVRVFAACRKRWPEKFWLRKNASTVASQAIDSFLFVFLAFYGSAPVVLLAASAAAQFVLKVSFAPALTPLSAWLVRALR